MGIQYDLAYISDSTEQLTFIQLLFSDCHLLHCTSLLAKAHSDASLCSQTAHHTTGAKSLVPLLAFRSQHPKSHQCCSKYKSFSIQTALCIIPNIQWTPSITLLIFRTKKSELVLQPSSDWNARYLKDRATHF